jgi:transposase
MNAARFIQWVRRRWVPRLRRGDIVVLDNLAAHKARPVRATAQRARRVGRPDHCRNWFAHAVYQLK